MDPRAPITPPAGTSDRDLASARALAEAGAWEDARAQLAGLVGRGAPTPELVTLYGESLLRTGHERLALEWLRQEEPQVGATDHPQHRQLFNLIGAACFALGALDDAAAAWSEALALASRHDDQLLLARASNNLGAIANMQGRHEAALGHYRLALPAYQRVGQARGIAEGYHNLAITWRDLGELDDADEHERRAIDYATTANASRVAAMGRVGRAEVALRRGDAPFAEVTASLAADEFAALPDPLNESDARRLVGAARTAQGRHDEACDAFASALSIAESRGYTFNEAEVLRDRAESWRLRGDRARARADAERAMALFESLGAVSEMQRVSGMIARLS